MIDKSASDSHNVTKDSAVNASCWNCFTVENDQDCDTEITLSQIRQKQRNKFKLYSVIVSEVYQPKAVSTKQTIKDNYVIAKKVEQKIINKSNDHENKNSPATKEVETNSPNSKIVEHNSPELHNKIENQDLCSKSANIVTPLNKCENDQNPELIVNQLHSIVDVPQSLKKEDTVIPNNIPITSSPNLQQKQNNLSCDLSPLPVAKETNTGIKKVKFDLNESVNLHSESSPHIEVVGTNSIDNNLYADQSISSLTLQAKQPNKCVDDENLNINSDLDRQSQLLLLEEEKQTIKVDKNNLDTNEIVTVQHRISPLTANKDITKDGNKVNPDAIKSVVNIQPRLSPPAVVKEASVDRKNLVSSRRLSPLAAIKNASTDKVKSSLDTSKKVNKHRDFSLIDSARGVDKVNINASDGHSIQRRLSPLPIGKKINASVDKGKLDISKSIRGQRDLVPSLDKEPQSAVNKKETPSVNKINLNTSATDNAESRLSQPTAPKDTTTGTDTRNRNANKGVKQHFTALASVKITTKHVDEVKLTPSEVHRKERDVSSLAPVKNTIKDVEEVNVPVNESVEEAVEDITAGIKNLSFSENSNGRLSNASSSHEVSSLKNLSDLGSQSISNQLSIDNTTPIIPIPNKKRPKYTQDFKTSLPILNLTQKGNFSRDTKDVKSSKITSRWSTLNLKSKSSTLGDEVYSAEVSPPNHATLPKRSNSPLPHDRDLQLDSHRFSLNKSGGQQNFVRSESMASVYSGAGDGARSSVTVHGEVQISLLYNYRLGALEVGVKRCRELAPVDIKRNRSDPYVKVYLLPDKSKAGKRKTKVKKNTLNPVFEETLSFVQPLASLSARTLWLSVWHADMFGRNDFLGEVTLPLADVVFDDPAPMWYKLHERTEQFEEQQGSRGDLIVALKLDLHESARGKGTLHVLVKEAKNLVATKPNGLADVFCKSYLLPERGRLAKQKTGVCSRTLNPKWEHTFTYRGISLQELSTRALELSLWDRDRLASNDFMGAIRLSLGTGTYMGASVNWMDSVGKEVSLWQRMLQQPNFWVENSIPLRPHLSN